MPVLVNYNKCNCAPTCFASNACPYDALHVDKTALRVFVEADKCGTCPAPCLNFCDAVALKYAPTLDELAIMQQELDGALTVEQAVEARKVLMEQMKAKAEAEKEPEQEVIPVSAPLAVTTQNFVQEVVQSSLPVLVDFWAEWCGPCKQIAPIIDELAKDFAGKIKFAKLNVDEEPDVAGQLGIQSIPTLMIFYGGQVADMIVGAVAKPELKTRLQRVVDAVAQLEARQKGTAAPTPAAAPPAPPRPNLTRPTMKPPRRLK